MEDGYVVLSDHKDSFIEGAEWADANPKSTWISVNEKLPPIEKYDMSIMVLVVNTEGEINFIGMIMIWEDAKSYLRY